MTFEFGEDRKYTGGRLARQLTKEKPAPTVANRAEKSRKVSIYSDTKS